MTNRSIFRSSIFSATLLLGLTSCSSSDSSTTMGDETEAVDQDAADAGDTGAGDAATDEPVEIYVIIGQTSGSAVAYQATIGSKVQIKLLNPDADDEFHLHGYDLSAIAPAGQEVSIEFTADQLGSFDLESHVTGEWILTLVVEE